MGTREISRRELLIQGGAAMAGMAFLASPLLSQTFPSRTGEEVVPWLDQPPSNPKPDVVANLRSWEELDSWLTPNDKFFSVGHYNKPVIDEKAWKLEIGGLVKHPMNLTLRELKSRPRKEMIFTLECSGNSGRPWMVSAVGNAKWTGTPLFPILNEAGVLDKGHLDLTAAQKKQHPVRVARYGRG